MPIQRLNHAVLYVRDVARTSAFYQELLGFEVVAEMSGKAAFLRAPGSTNDHEIGLFQIGSSAQPSGAGRTSVGLYHLAWEVDTLRELVRLRDLLSAAGALVGASDHGATKSLYCHDPDGLEFEVMWQVPAALIDDTVTPGVAPLDLDAEVAHWGADTVGGIDAVAVAAGPPAGPGTGPAPWAEGWAGSWRST